MASQVTHPTGMEVELNALDGNIREVQRRVEPAIKIIASVKDDVITNISINTNRYFGIVALKILLSYRM